MAKGKNGNNEGSIRKRKNGQWEGRYTIGYDSRGKQKQVSVYGKTRAEVAKKINEKVSAIQNGTYIVPRDITLSGWFSAFVKAHADTLPPITIHSLRHTNATLQIAGGVPLTTVAKRLGHANTVTTSKIYAHAIKSADEAAAETLENLLTPSANRTA